MLINGPLRPDHPSAARRLSVALHFDESSAVLVASCCMMVWR